ncbi:MAG: ergothioneine biosynthesis protein EgtB [Verrucomicrobia bacterium]|nr:ergothioneine biosynthesis protein EgtB [Verrucomicrobiota bacterium]
METAVANPHGAAETSSRSEQLRVRYRDVRDFTRLLTRDLEPEDCVVQSMPDVSPTKWHLAHTTWFFETFVLRKFLPAYVPAIPEYGFLFNSYYNAAGTMHRRDLRGLISRPTVAESLRYRENIDRAIEDLVSSASEEALDELEPLIALGLNHEQQHQELLLTDIKHVLAQNPLHPVFRAAQVCSLRDSGAGKLQTCSTMHFVEFTETMATIGHDGCGFAYDNEGPQHRVLIPPFALGSRLVSCGEYIEFIEDGGYQRPELWLSLGWTTVNEQRWEAPLYWEKHDGEWWHFTLSGFRRVEPDEPVTHVSYFEADAFANWSGARLPTEFEWEHTAQNQPIRGNFVESERFHPAPGTVIPSEADGFRGATLKPGPRDSSTSLRSARNDVLQMFGDCWEWTRSSYSPYPGYRAEPGALGEYNGKFMCNQYVLRGGSCATSQSHIRATYRNFFQPEKRWQFTGIRLARDGA